MSKSDERLKVLEMLSAGKINVEEAQKLLEKLAQSDEEPNVHVSTFGMNKSCCSGSGGVTRFISKLFGLGVFAGVIYLLFIYLPTQMSFDKLALILGSIFLVACVCACFIYCIVKKALNFKCTITDQHKSVDLGSDKYSVGPKKDNQQ